MSRLPFIAQVLGAEQEPLPTSHPIDPLAQAMELTDRLERMAADHTFEYGMLCRQKRGLGPLRTDPVLAFVRYLDLSSTIDQQIVADHIREHMINTVDCIVAMLGDKSECIHFLVGSAALLEPYEPWKKTP